MIGNLAGMAAAAVSLFDIVSILISSYQRNSFIVAAPVLDGREHDHRACRQRRAAVGE
jgi:hypothetical protein